MKQTFRGNTQHDFKETSSDFRFTFELVFFLLILCKKKNPVFRRGFVVAAKFAQRIFFSNNFSNMNFFKKKSYFNFELSVFVCPRLFIERRFSRRQISPGTRKGGMKGVKGDRRQPGHILTN